MLARLWRFYPRIQALCEEEIVRGRLNIAKDRDNRILGRDKAHQIYLLFKKAYEPIREPREVVDTSKDIVSQIQNIVETLPLTNGK